jgi:hypothetical protein
LEKCENTQIFNLTFRENNSPLCLTPQQTNIYIKKRDIIENYHLNFGLNSGYDLQFLDNLFYPGSQIANPSVFRVQSPENLVDFNNYISFAKSLRCERFNLTESYCLVNIKNPAQQKIEDLINILSSGVKSKFKFEGKDNNVEIIDTETKNVNINTFFISTDLKLYGKIMFYYSIQEGSIDTGYSVMAYNLDLLDNKVTSSKTSSQGSFTLNYEYITMLCVVFLILLAYVKNRYLNSIAETINRSFFLILFVLTVVAEILFKVYHMLKGTNDYVYLKQLLLNTWRRNASLLYSSNLRIFKALSVLTISYHLVYVVFTIRDLVVFTIFLKPVFQRFFIVLISLMLSLALMITIFLGNFYTEFSQFSVSFFNVFNYAIGVQPPLITDESTYTNNVTQMRFYFELANFIIRLIVLNFSMITMFYFYRKAYIKNITESLDSQKIKNNKLIRAKE